MGKAKAAQTGGFAAVDQALAVIGGARTKLPSALSKKTSRPKKKWQPLRPQRA
ncbi:hypothetical protein M2351_000046 [Azospirillum canadense]|nr:hypothetical protein [Azospirillum canadense]